MFILYRDGVEVMKTSHFYPIKAWLIKNLKIDNIYVSYGRLTSVAKRKGYTIEREMEEK